MAKEMSGVSHALNVAVEQSNKSLVESVEEIRKILSDKAPSQKATALKQQD